MHAWQATLQLKFRKGIVGLFLFHCVLGIAELVGTQKLPHTDAGVLRTYLTFQKFEELIQDLPCFLSCYRGCLVNMDRIHKTLEDSFLLDNQEVVQIRKRGANAIKKEYLNYLFS